MPQITGNEPAMPRNPDVFSGINEDGLTIRQHFAAMAMQGILANSEFLINHQNVDIHALSVNNADHLIAELNKEK